MEIWTEKYRPKKLDEIIGQKNVVKRLKQFVKNKNLPHVLFAGPAGIGKTSCALAIAQQLYGDDWSLNFFELNASDERGIDVIRGKIKDFARTMPLGEAPFKIIMLDESDALTREAQQALRRMMEKYTRTCRFILSCNYSSKIIDPIQSRCAVFRFKPIDKEDILMHLSEIAKKEKLKISSDVKVNENPVFLAIHDASEGDMRKAINLLQSCSVVEGKITSDTVFEVASYARPSEIKRVVEQAVSGKLVEARNLLFDTMLKYGLSGLDAVKQLQKMVMQLDMPAQKTALAVQKVAECEFRLVEGADPYIQLEALLAGFMLLK